MTTTAATTFNALRVEVEGGVATATIDNPPLHMLTQPLVEDLDLLTETVEADDAVRVLVLRSADPDIFITHNEFANLYRRQPTAPPTAPEEVAPNAMHRICERLRSMGTISIAQVEGHTAGGGSTMVMSCDLRFGALGKAVFNTMSVPLGAVPGGGASQYLPRLVGRSRALDLILGGLDLDAEQADRWGYLTRAVPADEIDAVVRRTARRIAASPPEVLRLTKELVGMSDGPIGDGLLQETFRFQQLMASPESLRRIATFLEIGGETRDGETRMGELLGEVLDRISAEGPEGAQA